MTFTESLLYSGQITGILVGIPYLSFSTAFDKAPYFLMSKVETGGLGESHPPIRGLGGVRVTSAAVALKGGLWCCALGLTHPTSLFILTAT